MSARWLLLCVLVGCRRDSTPETTSTAPPPAASNEPLSAGKPQCTVGGTKPAFFVWVETRANAKLTRLRATKFELRSGATFVSGAVDAIALRARSGPNGQGDVKSLAAGVEPGATLHLELFGELAFDAYGAGVTYPTEAREFRAELESDQGSYTLSGTCEVGPAG